ncbi:hypothetical protein BJ742DRAFT_768568 [Cladochytrium replicatum]|nr:hypothetical protein BJ742DRAFT_768568 [Cladochytrium replicatum]
MERGVSSRRRGRPTGSMGGGSRRQNYDSSPSFSSATAINTSALQNLVGRVLREEGGPQADAYSRKTTAASQLASLFSAMSQDELVSGLDVVFQTKPNGRPGLESAFEDPRATLAFRQMVSRAIISFGTAIKGDPRFFLRWLFAQVGGLGGQVVSPNEKDKDVRLALLGCLREIVDQLSQNSAINFGRYVDSILDDLQSVLDGPNAPECLPKILDVFHLIADRYPSKFSVHFPDIIDLLVGWSVDLVLTKATSSLIAGL